MPFIHWLIVSRDAIGPNDRRIQKGANGPIDRNNHPRSSGRSHIVRSNARSSSAPHVLSAFMTFMALVIAIIMVSCESRPRTHDCQSCSQSQCRQFKLL
jgi:hypothetical protein